MKTLFSNVEILIRKGNYYDSIKNAYLGVDGDKICYISTVKPPEHYDVVKDYTNKLLMPGIVNAHCHSPMVFMRSIANGCPLDVWLNDRIFPIESKMTPEIVKISSYYAILEMLASGVTSFTDMYFYPEETAQAVIDSGIKANLCKYVTSFDPNMKVEDSLIYSSYEFYQKYNGLADDRLRVDFSMHAEYTNQPHIIKAYSDLCKQVGARMHVHLSESKKEHDDCKKKYGKTPAQFFEDMGTFDSPTVAAHCVWVEKEDMKIFQKHDVSVSHNPSSNAILGNGFAKVARMLDGGINVCLGTDGVASNNNLNMFKEMHITFLVHNAMNLSASEVTVGEVLDMSTFAGAAAQGRKDTGILQVGKKADIVAVDMDKLHLFPNFNSADLMVTSAQGSDVYMTMVDGKILYENGIYLTLDKDQIVNDFKRIVNEFYENK